MRIDSNVINFWKNPGLGTPKKSEKRELKIQKAVKECKKSAKEVIKSSPGNAKECERVQIFGKRAKKIPKNENFLKECRKNAKNDKKIPSFEK